MILKEIHIAYFIGIGGIGMSALARWFRHKGLIVAGYDRTRTTLTDKLEEEGISVHFDDDIRLIPEMMLAQPDNCLVIYTPAIPKGHRELNFFIKNGYRVKKRSETLGWITHDLTTVAVAGTHGKTTTSSMIAHIMNYVRMDSVAFLGGILQGYESNLILTDTGTGDTIAVVEADEFDRSFLWLYPDMAVVTSMDPDHLDIYVEHEELKASFREFIRNIHSSGFLMIHEKVSDQVDRKGVALKTYGIDAGDCMGGNIRMRGDAFIFDYHGMDTEIKNIRLPLPGYHNVENAVAAISICLRLGIDVAGIKLALGTYKGVKRRFEYVLNSKILTYIDDYAHHPTEIMALLSSVRAMYPSKKITVIFQPHLFSRTRDFASGFAMSLDMADEVILMDIYPARELPISGVDSDSIGRLMNIKNLFRCGDDQLLQLLASRHLEVLLTVGAGDIDRFVMPIKQLLLKKYPDAA